MKARLRKISALNAKSGTAMGMAGQTQTNPNQNQNQNQNVQSRSQRSTDTQSALSVVALVYDGLCTFEYGIAAEVFGLTRPELERTLYRFSSVAIENKALRAAGGLIVKGTGTTDDLQSAHTLVIPGWRGKDEPVPKSLCNIVQQAYDRGIRLLSICSGSYVLAASGLLNNKKATTHWQYVEDFKLKFPHIIVEENALYVDEGNLITSAGSAAGIDACLHIVRSDYGAEIANKVARRLVMHSHRQGSQAQFIEQPVPASFNNQRMTQLMDEVRRSLAHSHSLESMAKMAQMSNRTFQRRFAALTGMPAKQWLTQERIWRACLLLETTELSIDQISHMVGFGQTDAMRYHFRQTIEVSPNDYRKRFKVPASKKPPTERLKRFE